MNQNEKARALLAEMQAQPPAEAPGWYCAHCQRGVDSSEVTYSEQHQTCGRYIANDDPPPAEAQAQGGGEPVATVRVTHGGFGMELSTHVAYALPEGTHEVFAAAPPSAPVGFDSWWHQQMPNLASGDEPDDRAIAAAAWAAALAQQPAADKFAATFRCENNGIVGYTNAPIHGVNMHDDGVVEIMIDYWPDHLSAADGYTTGHCERHKQPGGCDLHNLHCNWPECDRRPAAQPGGSDNE